ncbi:hypothetical protein KY328_01370 [Candidatus Woesearchaeota archaeon]|nr:hypothetical protein [Candidatus Woesearchaeota archaeon]
MTDYLNDAREELKRVDHLIYVSLKYTRTVDVIRSIVDRLINACDFLVDQLLFTAKQEGSIKELPKLPGPKCDKVKELYNDEKLNHFIDFYLKLRKIMRLEYTRNTEYRRHVYMGIVLDGEELRVNIDLVIEFYDKAKDFFDYVRELAKKEA